MRRTGFTLAELLIALGILGVIAVFAIPKVLNSQQDTKYKAIAKENAAAVSGAYDAYRLKTPPTANTDFAELTPYLNYVRIDTSSTIDNIPNHPFNPAATLTCDATFPCLRMHNGALMMTQPGMIFGGTAENHALGWVLDPDGKANGTRSVGFFIYFNGRITSVGNCIPNTTHEYSGSPFVYNPDPSRDPPWFGWD